MTRHAPGPAILIPAAGASTRMRGRDKLLEEVNGQPLLADRIAAAASAFATGRAEIVVTLPPRQVAPARWAALAAAPVRCVDVRDHRHGLSASLRAGIAALPRTCPGVMVLPADMPEITGADLRALLDAFDGSAILRGASAAGRPGHPVLFPAGDFAALCAITGDRGGRAVLDAAQGRVTLVPLPANHALTDLDTPEDWSAWRGSGP